MVYFPAVSSYDYYIWIRSFSDALGALMPVLVLVGVAVVALVGWRWWLRSRHGDPRRTIRLEKRVDELENRVAALEKSRDERADR